MSRGPTAYGSAAAPLVVLANGWNDAAVRWTASPSRRAVLITPADVCAAGWSYRSGQAGPVLHADLAGRVVAAADLAGVIVCLGAVAPDDLPHVRADDRDYAAAEVTAFLHAWLGAGLCPTLNAPSPGNLAGPASHPEEWALLAASRDIAVWPLHRSTAARPCGTGKDSVLVVVGDRVVGRPAHPVGAQALRLAQAAGTGHLATWFRHHPSGWRLTGADPTPDLGHRGVAAAAADQLRRGR